MVKIVLAYTVKNKRSEYNSEMFTYGKLVCIKCCSLTQSLIYFFFGHLLLVSIIVVLS